ncbi:MAG: hypothetical protein LPK03_07640, partial [Pontibacter sp.]|nr:hypothetical protein [Pontibacter sp.]
LETMKRHNKLNGHDALMRQIALYKQAADMEDDLLVRAQVNQRFREFFLNYGMVPEAIAVAEAYVEYAPTISTYLRDRRDEALANASWLKGVTSPGNDAINELARLVALKPQNYELRKQYAEVLASQGKHKEALETLEQAHRILTAAGSPRADYMVRMAVYQLQLQNKAAALAAIQPVLEGKLQLPATEKHLLVPVLAGLGLRQEARTAFKNLPRPTTVVEQANVLSVRGRMYEERGKLNSAIHTYENSLLLYPYQMEIRQRLVRLLKQKGRTKDADNVALAGEQLAQP